VFLTATFLINLLPTKVLNLESPVEKLLQTKPNYDALRTFGCACWPNLRPYNKRKLSFRSERCVFLGYSPLHKGVKCLDVSTGRIYISRDVVFDENVYPFQFLHPNAGAQLRKEIMLLPDYLTPNTSSHNEDIHVDDHMHIVPVTDPVQVPDDPSDDAPSNSGETAENSSSNDASLDAQQFSHGADPHVDSASEEASSGSGSESASAASPAPGRASASPVASLPGHPQGATSRAALVVADRAGPSAPPHASPGTSIKESGGSSSSAGTR
jgi:hypothetical protein